MQIKTFLNDFASHRINIYVSIQLLFNIASHVINWERTEREGEIAFCFDFFNA